MAKINLYWFKIPDGSSNYGDALNPFIITELSGQKVRYIPYPYKWYNVPYQYLHSLIRKSGIADFWGMIRSIFARKIIFCIGSIMHKHDKEGILVWGSGIGHSNWKIDNAEFKAVRGKETLKKLKEFGYNLPIAIGDPAILLPILIPPSIKKYKIGIIPHYIQYHELVDNKITEDFIIIDMKQDVHTVTEQITSCYYIASSSLHGLIVAQSYNIPALWVDFNCKNKLAGNNIKFRDYFSSVEIEPYEPIIINSFDINYFKKLFDDNDDKLLMKIELSKLQKGLLETAPFKIKKKYQIYS